MLYLANNRLLLINNGNSLYRIDSQTQPEPDMYTIPFTFTIDTTLGSNAGNTFELPLKNQGFNYAQYVYDDAVDDSLYFVPLSYDFIVDWGDGNTDHITTYNDINKTHTYSSNGVYEISILGKCEGWGKYDNLFEYNQLYNDSEKIISINRWGNCGFVDLYSFCDSCSNMTNVYNVDSSQTFINTYNMFDMFYGCTSLTSLDASNWNVSNVVDMDAMFYGCTSLTTLDVTNWDVTSVLSMGGMFDGDTPLSVTSYDNLLIEFASLSNLTPNIELHANISQYSCAAEEAHDTLTSSPNNWSITDAGLNVASCNSDSFIITIDTTSGTGSSFNLPLRDGYNYNFVVDWGDGNTSTVTSFDDVNKTHTYSTGGEYQVKITGICESWYFNNGGDRLKLTSIDQWGNTGFINMVGAFFGCTNLITANDTNGIWCSNVVSMQGMFGSCSSLTTLDVSNWDVSNVSDMQSMFSNCSLLETLDVSNWNVSNVTNMSNMFYNTPLNTPSYDALLNGWSGLPSLKSNVPFGANMSQYSCDAEEAHDTLTSLPNKWSIIDLGLNVDSCDDVSIPMDIGTGFNNSVISLIQDNDNKYVIGGNFSSYNGQFTNRLIRLEQDGTKDLTFNVSTNGTVRTIMEVTGNKYLIYGVFTSYNSVSVNNFVRVYQDGSIDTSFNTGTGFGSNNFTLWSITEDTNNKYIIGGVFTSYQGVTSNNIIRLNQDGSIDTDFNIGTGFNGVVYSIVEDNGKYVVVGNFTSYNGITSNRIIKLNYDGSVDTDFNIGTGFNSVVVSIMIDNTGKYVIGGQFARYNNINTTRIIRLNQDGSKDTSFNNSIYFLSIKQIKQDINGKYIVNGNESFLTKQNLIRLENDGSRDTTFSTAGFNQDISNFIIDNNNNFVVVGYFTEYNGTPYNYIIKLNQDGTPAMVV